MDWLDPATRLALEGAILGLTVDRVVGVEHVLPARLNHDVCVRDLGQAIQAALEAFPAGAYAPHEVGKVFSLYADEVIQDLAGIDRYRVVA